MLKIGYTHNGVHKYVIKNKKKEDEFSQKHFKESADSLIVRKATDKDLEIFKDLKRRPKNDEFDRYVKSKIGRTNDKFKTFKYH